MASILDFGIPVGGTGVLQPKLTNKWQVVFKGIGNNTNSQALTSQCTNVSRPSVNWGEVEMHRYNRVAYAMSKYTFDELKITVEDDLNSLASAIITQQIQRQQLIVGGGGPWLATAASGSDYKFGLVLQQLDGNEQVIEEWHYEGCWIKGADYGEADYTQGEILKINLTLRYDMVRQIILDSGSSGIALGGPS